MTDRLWTVLDRNRDAVAPDLPPDLIRGIAEIEERNQFDDDRRATRRHIRELIQDAVTEQMVEKSVDD